MLKIDNKWNFVNVRIHAFIDELRLLCERLLLFVQSAITKKIEM